MKTCLRHFYRAVLRTIKPKAGLARLVFNPIVDWLLEGLSPIQRATLADGAAIEVDLADYNGRRLWISGTNDWKISLVAMRLSAPGDVFLDIGANYGTVGLPVRHKVGDGHVHLIEPQPVLARRLEQAASGSGARNVTVHNIALFDRDGTLELVVPRRHSGAASLVATLSQDVERLQIRAWDTARFLEETVGDRPFGVKIDVEGAEKHIIPAVISKEALKFIIFECNRNTDVLFDIFKGSGMSVYGLGRNPFFVRTHPIDTREGWAAFHDLVAIPRGASINGTTNAVAG